MAAKTVFCERFFLCHDRISLLQILALKLGQSLSWLANTTEWIANGHFRIYRGNNLEQHTCGW